ncbi:MAG TPA: pentapeptide repeat-containing protein [Chthoniobacterales bacterium]|nr:pentapeptide repeat-containing protein [Chthoniobacterales bacterium]
MKSPALFLTIFLAAGAAVAKPQNVPEVLTPAETWIIEQTTTGEIADLRPQFPNEKDRKINTRFLEGLLAGALPGFKPHRNGIRIAGAVIDEPISFQNAHVPWAVWLEFCRFKKDVDFTRTEFANGVSFGFSIFEAGANFNELKVQGIANFLGSAFNGPVSFINANVSGEFHANLARFRNPLNDPSQTVSFNSMVLGSNAYFNGARFEDVVDMVAATVKGEFQIHNVEFNGDSFFEKMTCNVVTLNEVRFPKAVSFRDSNFVDLLVSGPELTPQFVHLMNLENVSIKRRLRLQFLNIDQLVADSLRVEGPAEFVLIDVQNSADLSFGAFSTLYLLQCSWPKKPSAFRFQIVTYKYISTNSNEFQSHIGLLKLADQCAYTADVYRNLENFFSEIGYAADKDEAFIAGKRRERAEHLRNFSWFGSLMLDWLIGYGRHPERAGYVCIGIVILGCILFPGSKMKLRDRREERKPDDIRPKYNRLWYSLGLFLPVVDLKTSDLWKPTNEHVFLQYYLRIHILLGWIFVPIFLAAISGLIK